MEAVKTVLSEEEEETLRQFLVKRQRYNVWRIYGSRRLLLISAKPSETNLQSFIGRWGEKTLE